MSERINREVIPVVSASPNYTAGDSIGTSVTLSRVVGPGRTTSLVGININDLSNQGPAMRLLFFNAAVTGTYTDNSALDLSAADLASQIAIVKILAADYETVDSYKMVNWSGLDIPMAGEGYDLVMAIVADDAWNAGTTADLTIQLTFEVAF